jgi:hypothetical protein
LFIRTFGVEVIAFAIFALYSAISKNNDSKNSEI